VPGVLGAEEALHALGVEAGGPALERLLGGRADLLGTFCGDAAEQHQQADDTIDRVLNPRFTGVLNYKPA